jgi:uncharacterized membrane protein YdjX (TVP38/TMEM64 family)
MASSRPQPPVMLKWLLLTIAIAVMIVVAKQWNIPMVLQEALKNALTWVESLGTIAPLAFILIYNLATVFLIPGSVLTLGGGVLFGLGWGSFYVFIAATLGATFAFLLGRYFTRDWVKDKIAQYPKFGAIEAAVAREGFKIVFLTRLSPIFPFNLLNYAFGITQVSLRDYIFGSIGMIPGTILYVYLGSLAGSLATLGSNTTPTDPNATMLQWALKIVGLIATVFVTVYITRIAKQALDTSVNKIQPENNTP